jgi:hypothetical protein
VTEDRSNAPVPAMVFSGQAACQSGVYTMPRDIRRAASVRRDQ